MSMPHPADQLIADKIIDYSISDGVDVFLFDGSGEVLLVDSPVPQESLLQIFDGLNTNVGDWEEGKTKEYVGRVGKQTTYNFAACVIYKGDMCKMLVRYPVSPLAGNLRQIELYMLLVALGTLLVGFFVSYLLAKRLSGPLEKVSLGVRELAAGNYDVQFDSVEYAEIADLSGNLNYMKDEIKKSDDFQKELLANVSHDLKTPLTMIKAYASMIQEISGDDPEKRNKHLQIIIDESDRLTGLVNDILNTSKIKAGIEQLNKKVFNLTELIYGVINKFSYLQDTNGYNIMVDVEPNLYTLGDEEKINQVIYNLVSNAVNYTGEDKTIYVSLILDAENNRIKFAVRDTGKGIAEEELAHIWDRYYRSKDSHTRPIKGTGLGLNIVKVILAAHKFEFGVDTKEGEGSTFYVYFPNN